jgi:hypothetical protein
MKKEAVVNTVALLGGLKKTAKILVQVSRLLFEI